MRKLLIVLAIVLSACNVYKNAPKQIAFPEYKIINPITNVDREPRYEDDSIAIYFGFNRNSIAFELTNKTDSPFCINWDESAIIRDGISYTITHVGIRYLEKNAPKPKTIVSPNAIIKDNLWIANDIYFREGIITGYYNEISTWVHKDLFNVTRDEGLPNEVLFKSLIDRKLSAVLTFEFENAKKTYQFDFRIESVKDKP